MEPEITAPAENGNKKKFFIITLVVILTVAGVALGYLFMQKDTPGQVAEVPSQTVVQEKKVYTQAEKEQILTQLASSLPNDTTTVAEETRTLNNISKKLPTNTHSDAERLKILEGIASSMEK